MRLNNVPMCNLSNRQFGEFAIVTLYLSHFQILDINMKIFLIGFMGSGKNYWGRKLSEKLGFLFLTWMNR